MLYFSILLHCIDLILLELLCRLCATSFTLLSSYSFIGHYMFRPNWPSSGIQVVMVKDSADTVMRFSFLLWWSTNTQQNSRPSNNIQGSHNQQTKQDHKQPRATQGQPNKTDGNPHKQNNQRQLQEKKFCESINAYSFRGHWLCLCNDLSFHVSNNYSVASVYRDIGYPDSASSWSSSMQIPGWYFKLGHDRFFLYHFQIIIHHHLSIQRYIVRVNDSVVDE
jgi:hypothetical protein